MKTKRVLALTLVLAMAVSLVAYKSGEAAQAPRDYEYPEMRLRAGFQTMENSGYVQGIKQLSDKLSEITGGKITIETFSDGVLGSEVELIEFVSMGSLDICVTSTSPMANYVQEFFTFDLPYLVTDLKHAHVVMDGPLGRELLDKLLDIGIYGMALWDNGFRHFSASTRRVTNLSELSGFKIRVMENELHQRLWTMLGAYATPMSVGEVITAIQQGTIDGQENPLNAIISMGVYEVLRYIALTGHVYTAGLVSMNQGLWDGFSPEVKAAFNEAIVYATAWERDYIANWELEARDFLEEQGLEIYEIDITDWAAAVSGIYDVYADRVHPALVQALRGE